MLRGKAKYQKLSDEVRGHKGQRVGSPSRNCTWNKPSGPKLKTAAQHKVPRGGKCRDSLSLLEDESFGDSKIEAQGFEEGGERKG